MGNLITHCRRPRSGVEVQPRALHVSRSAARKVNGGRLNEEQLQQLVTSLESCSSALAEREAAVVQRRTTPGMRLPHLRCVEPLGSLVRLIQSTQNTREQKEAIGAVIRGVTGATLLLLEMYTYQSPRALTLETLLWLTSDEFDASGASLFREALRNSQAIEDLCSFVYLSPMARSGGADDVRTLRRVVYYSLATLNNLIATADHCRRMARAVPRLRELATPPDPSNRSHPCNWAGNAISSAAARCLTKYLLLQSAALSASTSTQEQTPVPLPSEAAVAHEPTPLERPDLDAGATLVATGLSTSSTSARHAATGRLPRSTTPLAEPTRAPGFHDFSAPLALGDLPLVPYRPPSDAEASRGIADTCTICLEEYVEAEMLRVLPCQHRFHANCLDCWVQSRAVAGHARSCRCPNCNKTIALSG